MSTKLKALGLGLVAALAMSAFGVMNAMANSEGHLVTEDPNTTLVGTEGGEHSLHLVAEGGGQVGCDKDAYHGEASESESTVSITPDWGECYTTPDEGEEPEDSWDINEQGCSITLTVSNEPTTSTTSTAGVDCENAGEAILVEHPDCLIEVPETEGEPYEGIGYTNNADGTMTMHVDTGNNGAITVHYEEGPCVFLGTTHGADMKGSVTVEGQNASEELVPIEATG